MKTDLDSFRGIALCAVLGTACWAVMWGLFVLIFS